ncbi:MAG: GGDEF domain-containing protein [Steroidobacteraceae bacterium]
MSDSDWKSRYFNAIRDMEDEEKRYRAIESALRRVVSRLCIAAQGQDDLLDANLSQISSANHRNAGAGELDNLLQSLRDTVADIDRRRAITQTSSRPATVAAAAPPPASAPTAAPTPPPTPTPTPTSTAPRSALWEEARKTVMTLLPRLSTGTDDAAAKQVEELLAQLASVQDDAALARLLTAAADLALARSDRLLRERDQATALLAQVTQRLEEVSTFLTGDEQNRRSTLGDAEELNTRVLNQVSELNDEVRVARDLEPLKQLIGERVEAIASQVRQFREREEGRFLEQSERTQRMNARVAELERQTRDLHRSLHQERRRARLDALTGIPNRISFDERLAEEIERWKRFGNPVCVLVWDIDRFKHINDTYGHRAGDRVLREVAKCFEGRLRSTDIVARFGGEEFVMLLIGTQLTDAHRKADDLRKAIGDLKFHFRGEPIRVTVSCGITELRPGDEAGDVFDRADKALYSAKDGGRDACVAA